MCTVNACSRLTSFISFGTAGGAMPTVPRLMVASLTFLPLREGVDGDGVRAGSRVSGGVTSLAIMQQLCGSCASFGRQLFARRYYVGSFPCV